MFFNTHKRVEMSFPKLAESNILHSLSLYEIIYFVDIFGSDEAWSRAFH